MKTMKTSSGPFWLLLACTLMSLIPDLVNTEEDHPLGCGGFVRSVYKLDYSKIEIKLFTKQGSLKMRTECAPTTGYYFMPLDGEGDYVLKISPPEGWVFEPAEYEIQVDGVSDKCSKGIDINFDFKGFSVLGNVVTEGFKAQGPSGVTLTLANPKLAEVHFETKTRDGGSFAFEKIPPGNYILKASHPTLSFGKDTYSFDLTNKNVEVENQLTVSGFQVTGKVRSDKNPVQGVQLVLLGASSATPVPTNCEKGKLDGFIVPTNSEPNSANHFLCHQVSDPKGTFQFSNVKPGKYALVPVYKGKNIVYNVSPDRLEFDLGHGSADLEKWFEVEGFSVQGRVKNIPGASVLVNGELKATSGPNGEFTIAKMRPGTYDFEITAENVQFDKQRITISPANPILPDFVPARFLVCGSIGLNQQSIPDLTLIFIDAATLKSDAKSIHTEKVADLKRTCVFLKPAKYQITVASKPYKSFSPEKVQINVPSENSFAFQEFTGFISGIVKCSTTDKLKSDLNIVVQLRSATESKTLEQNVKCDESYKFSNLEAGHYIIQIMQSPICWENPSVEVSLESSNINNANFKQVGHTLHITSTHATKVSILVENEKKQRRNVEDVDLVKSVPRTICLKESSSSSYIIEPNGCHIFEKEAYIFTVGSENELNLVAKQHKYSGQIRANAKILDLQVKKDDEVFNPKAIVPIETGGSFIYDISFYESPRKSIELHFSSFEFILEPNSLQVQTGDDCQTDLFQISGKKSHVIQGKLVPPLDDVEIRVELEGNPDATVYVRSNPSGEYIAGPFIHNRGFNVYPVKSGYTFKPMEKDPFSFQVLQWAKIQVKIIDAADPTNGIPNALLSLSGPNAYRLNKITDSNGEMLFGDLQPGEYYLKPLLREFSFEPNAVHIDLKEQESKLITLKASRESFSMYGSLSTLSGDLVPNLIVTAKGQGNCSEYAEDGISDEFGNFRIWALKAYCTYRVSVVMKDEFAHQVERTIPEALEIKIGNSDTQDISFVIITPVKRMDISLRVHTNSAKYLDNLRALVYKAEKPDTPLHSMPFNGISYIILPPIPTDRKEYFIVFDSTLNRNHHDFALPAQINFTADRAYEHFAVEFNVQTVQIEQEVGKSSYFAFAFIILAFLIITYFEKISIFVKEYVDKYVQSSASIKEKKVKNKSKAQ